MARHHVPRTSLAFDKRTTADATYGAAQGDFVEQFRTVAEQVWLRGSEPVIAQRLQGLSPSTFRVRAETRTRAVDSSWRIRDTRTGKTFNILSIIPDDRDYYIDMLCQAGGTDG